MNAPSDPLDVLSESQREVYKKLRAAWVDRTGFGPYGNELHGEELAMRTGFAKSTTSDALHRLLKMGWVEYRDAPSTTHPNTRWRLWKLKG